MNFFSNAVRLIGGKRELVDGKAKEDSPLLGENLELDFSLRNYAKESFSVLIVKPLSRRIWKIIRTISLLIIGASAGLLLALLCFVLFLQFGPLENTFVSSQLQHRLEKLLPESELSMKSAILQWNASEGAIEIAATKVRCDDLTIPMISILPDYVESLKQHRLIAKTVSLMNPKIGLGISDDFKKVSVNPNLEKGGNDEELLTSITVFDSMKNLLNKGTVVNIVNADVSIFENGVDWRFKSVCCKHKVGERFPQTISCAILAPEQKYISNISLTRLGSKNGFTYDVKLESINPFVIGAIFAKRNIPLDNRILAIIDGHNLPVSGTLKLNFEGAEFIGGQFDLIGASGSIKLPMRDIFSINLGKQIDNGSISGSFSKNNAKIDSINISYGNSGFQLTGIDIPLREFELLNKLNVCGTLSLTNINVQEMETILPENISKSAVDVFKNYLPEFRLEFFKTDLHGTITFDNITTGAGLAVGHGIFKIKDAKIPLDNHIVTNVDATGVISHEGFDIKLTNAIFKKIKINSGAFFIFHKDNSWIGKVNATIAANDAYSYASDISSRLAALPFEKMHIDGDINLDMKLTRAEGDNQLRGDLPFRIAEGECTLKSADNQKELNLSWNNEKLLLNGNVTTDQNKINIKMEENRVDGSGSGELVCYSKSDFLATLIPSVSKICAGNYTLKISSHWKGESTEHNVDLDLNDATMTIPVIGDVKSKKEEGRILAHIFDNGKNFEFSEIFLNTKNNKINGKISFDREGNLQKCSLEKFQVNDNSAKINIMRDQDNVLFGSIIGDRFDVGKIFCNFDKIDKNLCISAYVNLKEMIVSSIHKVKNAKGSLDIKNGKITGGTCYGAIGDGTTLALVSKSVEKTGDTILSLSASNAGEFLKHLKIVNTIVGGSINCVTKSSKNASQPFTASFEINDFIVKDNNQLQKLILLSFPNCPPDCSKVGFNSCMGDISIANNQITIKNGRAIGPTMGVSFNGSYDRMSDNVKISGMAVPISTHLSNPSNTTETLVSCFSLAGSIGEVTISVKPLEFIANDIIYAKFGNMIPTAQPSKTGANTIIAPLCDTYDPFTQEAFDKKLKDTKGKTSLRKRSIDNKFGIKITRGMNG
ncbi:MAG: hypothetical protein LBE95_00285 [Holosporaceae bacterium]|jgi:hypothetical protein|nr:hypothetical protein [Holosporaceae bacterium]